MGKDGFEPTQPEAPDLQSGVALQLYGLPHLNYHYTGTTGNVNQAVVFKQQF